MTSPRRTAPTGRPEHLPRAGHVADVLGCALTLADIELTRAGSATPSAPPRGASRWPPGVALLRGTADMYVGLSRVASTAATWPRRPTTCAGPTSSASPPACRSTRTGGGSRWPSCGRPQGDRATALGLLEEAERVYVADFAPQVRPVAAVRARVLAASGQVAEALGVGERPGCRRPTS